MSYIDAHVPEDWGFSTLFCHPYQEAGRHFSIAFPDEEDGTLAFGRYFKHLSLGILFCIPLLNTISLIFFRCFFRADDDSSYFTSGNPSSSSAEILAINQHIWRHHPREYPKPLWRIQLKEEYRLELEELNDERNALMNQLARLENDDPRRADLNAQMIQIERKAARTVELRFSSEVEKHLESQDPDHPDYRAMRSRDCHLRGSHTPIRLKGKAYHRAKFSQKPGLHQFSIDNWLCGYYALFYMLQAATGESFTDRRAFAPILEEWLYLIAEKRAAAAFGGTKGRANNIPPGLHLTMKGIGADDLKYLVENSRYLEPLRETAGCFVLDVQDFNDSYHEFRGHEDYQEQGKVFWLGPQAEDFPAYIIIKDYNCHFSFAYARKPWDFVVVHSLNTSVLNNNPIDDTHTHIDTFRTIVNCLDSIQKDK